MTGKLAQVEVAGKSPHPRADDSTPSGGLGGGHHPQRRDHRPVAPPEQPRDVHWAMCLSCGDMIHRVYDRTKPVKRRWYWRHHRRPR